MSNTDRVLRYLQSIHPEKTTNSDILHATGIEPHQQVFQITKKLLESGKILGTQVGREWHFQVPAATERPKSITSQPSKPASAMNPRSFETLARKKFTEHFKIGLTERNILGIGKRWDMVSSNGSIVGDAKYYTLVRGTRLPPAKFATIAEHVWLLEKTNAEIKFLVFGNQIEVPQRWLEKYGNLITDVQFYFMDDSGKITKLN